MKILKVCFLALLPLAMLWLGAVLENVRVTRYAAQHAHDDDARPIAFIGMAQCNQLIGAIFILHDGSIVDLPDKTPISAIQAEAAKLPSAHATVANIPCPGAM